MTEQIQQMISNRTGGGLIINKLLDPSADLGLETMLSSCPVLDEPFDSETFRNGFSPDDPHHDEFTVLELIDRNSGGFAPRIRSLRDVLQLAGASDNYPWTQGRHYKSYLASKDTSALALAVSGECGRLSVFEGGNVEIDVGSDGLRDRLKRTSKNLVNAIVSQSYQSDVPLPSLSVISHPLDKKPIQEERELRNGDTFSILENCAQSVLESALWHHEIEVNHRPHIFARSKVDYLRQKARLVLVRHYSERFTRVQCSMTFGG